MIYLASTSPRRRELLASIGVAFTLLPFRGKERQDAAIDETPLAGEAPAVYALRIARAKAEQGKLLMYARGLPALPVLAADTTLDVDNAIIGKPADAAEAIAILLRLSGRSHRVITTVALAATTQTDVAHSVSAITRVRFRHLNWREIERYVASGEPLDKAGAYGIQGAAAMFIERIEGSPSGVMGLPLCETVLLLRRAGLAV